MKYLMSAAILLFSHSSWALSPSDFYCLPAPFGMPSVFSKVAKSCDANGTVSVGEEEICSEGARCTIVSDAVKRLNMSPAQKDDFFRRMYNADYRKMSEVHMVPGMGDSNWLVSDLMCPKDKVTGKCPLPENCKGDVYYNPSVSDYAHPDVDKRVQDSTDGKGNPIQHQGSGNPNE
jgi:hypothetical protein